MKANTELIDILLIDDNEDDALMVKDAFSDAHLINLIQVFLDSREALDYLFQKGKYEQSMRPGLILLDINMPKISGFQLLEIIKNNESLKSIPVVMLTTSERDEDILKSYEKGACSYVTKPVNVPKLSEVIKHFSLYWTLVSKVPKVK